MKISTDQSTSEEPSLLVSRVSISQCSICTGAQYTESFRLDCDSENMQLLVISWGRPTHPAAFDVIQLMVQWVVGSILHGVDPLSYFSFQPVLHDWCNKGRGMYYPVCGMVHIKEPLLLIDKSSLCGGSGFPS